MKRHSLVQISVSFRKKNPLLKSIYSHFKTPTKRMIVFIRKSFEKVEGLLQREGPTKFKLEAGITFIFGSIMNNNSVV